MNSLAIHLSCQSIPMLHNSLILQKRSSDTLVCDEVNLDSSCPADLPDVVVDAENRSVSICGSTAWRRLADLPGLFVGIMSHESIHHTLLKIDRDSSDNLDDVASLSAVTRSLKDIVLVSKYKHGMIGFHL